jgi:hypothetical protein
MNATYSIQTPTEARAQIIAMPADATQAQIEVLMNAIRDQRNAAHAAKDWKAYTAWDVEHGLAEKMYYAAKPKPAPATPLGKCRVCGCKLTQSDVVSTGRRDLCHDCA